MNLDAFIFISTFGILLSAVNNIIVNKTYLSPISSLDMIDRLIHSIGAISLWKANF
jgi:hypothetical protein